MKPKICTIILLFTFVSAFAKVHTPIGFNGTFTTTMAVDTSIHLCSMQPVLFISDFLRAPRNGTWEPKTRLPDVFDPAFDIPGVYRYIFTNTNGVLDTNYLEIFVHPERNIELGPPIRMCRAERQTVDIPKKSGDAFSWNDGVTEPKRYIYSPGTYIVTLMTVEGCVLKDTLLILPSFDKIPKNVEIEICNSETYTYKGNTYYPGETITDSIRAIRGCDTLLKIKLIPFYPFEIERDTFTCNNIGISIQDKQYFPGDTIISFLVDPTGCDTIVRTIYKPYSVQTIAISASDTVLCPGKLVTLTASSSSGIIWSTGATEPSIQVASGTYTLAYSDDKGCETNDTVKIEKAPDIQFSYDVDSVYCNANNGSVVFNNSDPSNPFVVFWNGSQVSQDTINHLATGTYPVAIRDKFGCAIDTIISIPEVPFNHVPPHANLYVPQGIDTLVSVYFIDQNLEIVNIEPNIEMYIRDTAMVINGQTNKTYAIVLSDRNGCQIDGTLSIEIVPVLESVTLPNIIAMRATTYENRSLFVKNSDVLYDLQVYDRWGNLRFSKEKIPGNTPSDGWTPQDIESGVYIYIIDVYTRNVHLHKYGDVLVLK